MEDITIKKDERVDTFGDLKIIQKIDGPHFSVDAILLAKFSRFRKGDLVVDLGTGVGIIPLLIARNSEVKKIIGVEIQPELVDIARRNVSLNSLEDKIEIIELDLRMASDILPAGKFDVVVSNPPYRIARSGRINPNPLKAISRHEILCKLEDVLKASYYLLKDHGRANFVYRPDRLVDLIVGCRAHRLEPKRIQFVHPSTEQDANLLLLESIKNGRCEAKILKPLIISGHAVPVLDEAQDPRDEL